MKDNKANHIQNQKRSCMKL